MDIDRKDFLNSPARWKNRLYNIWDNMIRRCYNKNNSNYPRYGGRKISGNFMTGQWLIIIVMPIH